MLQSFFNISNSGALRDRATAFKRSLCFRVAYWMLVAFFAMALFLYLAVKAIFDIYGQITITPVLFHLAAGGEGEVPWEILKLFIPWGLKYVGGLFLILGVAIALFRFNTVSQAILWLFGWIGRVPLFLFINRFPVVLAVIVFVAVPVYWGRSIDRKLHVVEFFSQPDSSWIEEHYAKLDVEPDGFHLGEKPNLIVLFLESMEQGYSNSKIFSENLISELQSIRAEGVSFSGYRRTPGSAFTMDGMSAQLLGIPVVASRIGLDIHNRDAIAQGYGSLLRNAPSVFNFLELRGWSTAAFTGASERFTMKGDFFRIHGIRDVYSREYFNQHGFKEEGDNQGPWGYNDSFLYQRLKDWLSETGGGDRPFAVLVETVDTHTPEGFVLPGKIRFKDGRDAIVESSRMAKEFIEWAKTQSWYDNTVIYIAGDHPWQDWTGNSLTPFTKELPKREIYNVILNSRASGVKAGDVIEVPGGWTAMDIAPTLLDSMGLPFESEFVNGERSAEHLGLGTSLYKASDPNSGVKTWVSQEGEEKFTTELQKPSRFYDSLF